MFVRAAVIAEHRDHRELAQFPAAGNRDWDHRHTDHVKQHGGVRDRHNRPWARPSAQTTTMVSRGMRQPLFP
jgi:hypothetical protein